MPPALTIMPVTTPPIKWLLSEYKEEILFNLAFSYMPGMIKSTLYELSNIIVTIIILIL